jgi:hypothetical protein
MWVPAITANPAQQGAFIDRMYNFFLPDELTLLLPVQYLVPCISHLENIYLAHL